MAGNKKVTRKKDRTGKSKSWTLLLVGDLGKIASFQVSRLLLMSFVGTIAFLLVYAGLMTVGYYRVHSLKTGMEERLAKTEAKLSAVKEDRDAAQVRLMLLGEADPETMEDTDGAKPKKGSAVQKKSARAASPTPEPREEKKVVEEKKKERQASLRASAEASEPTSPSESEETEEASAPEGTPSSAVTVKDFQIWPANNNTSVRYKFKLENVSPRDITLKGYTFVALEPGAESDEPVRIAPWTPLKDGQPSLVKRGQYFGISRFKYVRGSLPDIRDVTRFGHATVYVYSESGNLLHKEVCQVDAALRSRNAG